MNLSRAYQEDLRKQVHEICDPLVHVCWSRGIAEQSILLLEIMAGSAVTSAASNMSLAQSLSMPTADLAGQQI